MAPNATSTLPTHTTEHTITVAAPPETVYRLIADARSWPLVFGPTVHVEPVGEQAPQGDPASDGGEQLLEIWAFAGGQVRHWTSTRTLDADARRVVFRQVRSAAPVAHMGGEWRVEPHGDGGSRVTLLHDYRAEGNDPGAVVLITEAVDTNSRAELAALKSAAEGGFGSEELCFTFSDTVEIAGRAADVFTFLDRADRWPDRLPHVARLDLTEDEPGVQHMDMDTRSPDGSLHNTTSVRVCFADRNSIVYKQLRVPVAMSGHTGRWEIVPSGDGVRATSWHTVTLDPEGVRSALGPDATLAEARALVRKALGTNSTTTLLHAKQYAESHDAPT